MAIRQLAGRRANYRNEAPRVSWLAFAKMLKRTAARITRAGTVNALDGLVKDGKAAMAGRTVVCACAAFAWAHKQGGAPINPFQGLPIVRIAQSRDRVPGDAEIADARRREDVLKGAGSRPAST